MWRKITGEIFTRYIFIIDIVIILIFSAFLAASIDQFIANKVDFVVKKIRGNEGIKGGAKPAEMSMRKSKQESVFNFKEVDGEAILERNFFDSQAGPLSFTKDSENDIEGELSGLSQSDISQSLTKCSTQIKVLGLFASDDPKWSFAAVDSGGKAKILGIGEQIQGHVVNEITWKYLILSTGDLRTRCYLDIWQEQSPALPPKSVAIEIPGGKKDIAAPQPPSEIQPTLTARMNSSITDVSETEKNVDRSFLEYLVQNRQSIMESEGRIKTIPNIENEAINGFKVYGVRKTSLWGKLGIQNGDVVHSVNGIELTGGDSAMDALSKFRSSDKITLTITRRGQKMNLTYNIK